MRIDLHHRRIGGWVTALDVVPPPDVELLAVSKVRGAGPPREVVELARWGAWRWAGRLGSILATASPLLAVPRLPPAALRAPAAAAAPLDVGDGLSFLRLAPAVDLTPLVAALAQGGPTLVVVPTAARAAVLAARLRRAGGDVALLPGDWPQARAGAAVVVGARAAVWAPCPGLACIVVVDAHDEALHQEQAPTWSALDVAVERARRAGARCVVVSPCPTAAMAALGPVAGAGPASERAGWATFEVVDMRDEDPRAGLWSRRVVDLTRRAERLVVVLNRTGRARLLTCTACASVAGCERCGAALAAVAGPPGAPLAAPPAPAPASAPYPASAPAPAPAPASAPPPAPREVLACPRCGLERPVVCQACGSTALRRLRIGVARAREQLEALAARPVGEVTSATTVLPDAPVLIGTSAVLHRIPAGTVDAVAMVDLDAQLLAPRYRAGEDAMALLALASRLVGPRTRPGGRVVVQTRQPDHPVIDAARRGDPSGLAPAELELRRALDLPPASAMATLLGPGAAALGAALGAVPVGDERWVLRAPAHAELCDRLASSPRPEERVRIHVDPLEL